MSAFRGIFEYLFIHFATTGDHLEQSLRFICGREKGQAIYDEEFATGLKDYVDLRRVHRRIFKEIGKIAPVYSRRFIKERDGTIEGISIDVWVTARYGGYRDLNNMVRCDILQQLLLYLILRDRY
jgi:hypothetical protein